VSVQEFLEITFPERSGFITVETAQGFFLGKYHPDILIPRHEFFRLQVGCSGRKATYRGLHDFREVRFDTDMVPFSDSYRWKQVLKAYEMSDASELSAGQERALARVWQQLAATGVADMSSDNNNFNPVVISSSAKSMLSVSKHLTRKSYGWRRY
jgi:hypothetical protein